MPTFSDIASGYTAEDLLPGIGYEESRLNPKTRYGPYIPKLHERAMGEYQVLPETARRFGFSPSDMFDPIKNREAARRYLDWLLHHYHGDPFKTIEAYHTGEGNVDRGTIPQITRSYAHNVAHYPATQAAMRRVRGRPSELKAAVAGPPDEGWQAPSKTTELSWTSGREGESAIQRVPHLFDIGANLREGWSRIEPYLERGWSNIGGPSLQNMFSRIGDYLPSLPQGKVHTIVPEPGEVIR